MKNSGLIGKRSIDNAYIISLNDSFYQTLSPRDQASLAINNSNVTDSAGEYLVGITAVDVYSGDKFVILGTGLAEVAGIILAGQTITDFTIVSDTEIIVNTLPVLSSGVYDLFVKNANSTAAAIVNILYNNEKPLWETQDLTIYITPGVAVDKALKLNYNIDENESYEVSASTPLPTGLALTTAGVLTGTVGSELVGTYSVTIIAKNTFNQTTSKTFSFVVRDKRWDVTALTVGKDYSEFGSTDQLGYESIVDILGISLEATPYFNDGKFSTDGQYFYLLTGIQQYSGHYIIQFYCKTPWDFSKVIVVGQYFMSAPTMPNYSYANAMFFKPDGTAMYISARTSSNVSQLYQFALTTPWAVSSAVYQKIQGNTYTETLVRSIFFKPDGTKLWQSGETSGQVHEFTLSTPWDIGSTVDYVKSDPVSRLASGTHIFGIFFNTDGTNFYYSTLVSGNLSNRRTILTTPWTLGGTAQAATSTGSEVLTANNVFPKPDGTHLYVILQDRVADCVASGAFDFTTITPTRYDPRSWVNITDSMLHRGSNYIVSSSGISSNSNSTVFDGYIHSSCIDYYGKNLYILDNQTRFVARYELTTASDVSSAVFSESWPVPAAVGALGKIRIHRDGLELFISESGTNKIHTISLPNRYSLKLASYDSYGVFPGIVTAYDISANGSRVYAATSSTTNISVYQLSQPWDMASNKTRLSTILYTTTATGVAVDEQATRLMISEQGKYTQQDSYNSYKTTAWRLVTTNIDGTPQAVVFSPDGIRMYTTGSTSGLLQQFRLSVAWDVSTAVQEYAYSIPAILQGGLGGIHSIRFNDQGTILYSVTSQDDIVYQHSLTTAWDLSTVAYSTQFSIAAQEASPTDIFFGNNGTKMYVIGSTGDDVNQYALGTAWDVSSAVYEKVFSFVGVSETAPNGISFSSDGTIMHMVGSGLDNIYQYTLSTAWDVGSAVYEKLLNVNAQDTVPNGIFFKPDGTKMYMIGTSVDSVHPYTLSTAWDIASATYEGYGYKPQGIESVPNGMAFKPDGTALYILGTTLDRITEYTLSEPWIIRSARYLRTSFTSVGDTTPVGVYISPDGVNVFAVGSGTDTVYRYTAATAWNFAVITLAGSFSVAVEETTPSGLFFKPDGTVMYIIGSAGDDINQYTLGTAWDITTAVFNSLFSIGSKETAPSDLWFDSTGTRLYVIGTSGDDINQYTLGTAWDITTAVFVNQSILLSNIESAPLALALEPTGKYAYVLGSTQNIIQLEFK